MGFPSFLDGRIKYSPLERGSRSVKNLMVNGWGVSRLTT